MVKLNVAILARDNESEIADCLRSVDWADERVVILDTRSADRTAEIARSLGARVVEHRFENFARQREFGLGLFTPGEWLFYLDSDERATPALGKEMRWAIQDGTAEGWWVPRRNFFWGHEVRYGGWRPDYQLRLLHVGRAHYDMTREVHEIVVLDGTDGHLREPLIHYNYRTMAQFTAKQRQYVAYEAAILHKQGVRPKPWTYLFQPLREFHRRYIILRGYHDGWFGFVLCAWVAYYYGFVVTWRLGRLWRES